MQKFTGYLRLMRPANIITAIADILAGIAISDYMFSDTISYLPVFLLILSTMGLYGGGVVLNDVFDSDLDKIERPERPIPSGLLSKQEGALLGTILLLIGIGAAAYWLWYPSGVIALTIAIAAIIYNRWSKHHALLGPLNMGLCRGLNLLLGISIVPSALLSYNYLIVVPILYIGAITMISQGEVHGGKKITLYLAAFFYLLVIGFIFYVSRKGSQPFYTVAFLIAFAAIIFPPLFKAISNPSGKQIGKAVKAGIIALIVMNAAWAAAVGAMPLAIVILVLLPLSIGLSKLFAVT